MRTALAEIFVDLTQLCGALRKLEGDQEKACEAIETAAHCVAVAVDSLDGDVVELDAQDLAIMGIHAVLLFIEDGTEGFEASTRILAHKLRIALFPYEGTLDLSMRAGRGNLRH